MNKPLNTKELKGSKTLLSPNELNNYKTKQSDILAKTSLKSNKSPSADELILNALLHGARDITANNGLKYQTTRISNHIVTLRKAGLIIYTERIRTINKKWYGIYLLDTAEPNRARAFAILAQMRKARKSRILD